MKFKYLQKLVAAFGILTLSACGGGGGGSSGNPPTGNYGQLTASGAPAAMGDTFAPNTMSASGAGVQWSITTHDTTSVYQEIMLAVIDPTTQKLQYLTFTTAQTNLSNASVTNLQWGCDLTSGCTGVVLDLAAGTATFTKALFTGHPITSTSPTPASITFTGTLQFTPSSTGTPSSNPPTVTALSPTSNATNVPTNSVITATFSTAMLASSINATTFTVSGVTGTVSLSGNTATFTPATSLTANTTYTATITTGAKNTSGTALASAVSWSFTTGANTSTTVSGNSYLFYTDQTGGGELSAIDPASPTNPITVESSGLVANSWSPVLAATYSSSNNTVTNAYTKAFIFGLSDGHLYKVSTLISDGTPTPAQLSNETAANTMCGVAMSAQDYANPDHSQYIYKMPDTSAIGATCASGPYTYWMVSFDMTSTSSPVAVNEPVAALHDSTGALSGWLVKNSSTNNVDYCNVQFTSCSTVAGYTNSAQDIIGTLTSELISIDNDIYVFNTSTNTLSSSLFNDSTLSIDTSEIDANNYYFANNGSIDAIYSVPLDGSSTATQMIPDAGETIENLGLTSNNKLIYQTSTKIVAISTSATTTTVSPKTLVSAGTGESVQAPFWTNANHIYYNTADSNNVPTAGMIDDDGSNGSVRQKSEWIDATMNSSISFSDISTYKTIVRADFYDSLGTGKGFGGGTLSAFDMATGTDLRFLGSVPTDMSTLVCSFFETTTDPNVMCGGIVPTATYNSDVFTFNADTATSLTRITTTPSVSEIPLL